MFHVFDLPSVQDATENCHYPELVGDLLRLEFNFTFPPEHATELIVLEARIFWVAFDKFAVVGKNYQNGYSFSGGKTQSYPATQLTAPWFVSF